jgi:tellurite resistance protein TehA-like permease
MTALWLLPIVSCVVASACSGIVAGILTNASHALTTLICGYLLWGMGFPMAALVLAIYFARLALHNLPPRDTLVSVFLPLGPMGMGGYAMMQLGLVAKSVLPATGALSPNAGEMLYVGGFAVALVLWGWGFVWGFIAVASVTRGRFPFNMGWWGFVFPIGVFSVSTLTLGKELPSPFFDYLGTVLAAAVILIWTVVAVGTVRKTVRGEMLTSVHCEQIGGRGGRGDEEAVRAGIREGEGEDGEKRNVD